MNTEPTTQKWYQSKIVRMAGALFLGLITYLGVTYGVLDNIDLQKAEEAAPGIVEAVNLLKTGQIVAGISALFMAVIGYFRIFKTTKFIALSLPNSSKKAA